MHVGSKCFKIDNTCSPKVYQLASMPPRARRCSARPRTRRWWSRANCQAAASRGPSFGPIAIAVWRWLGLGAFWLGSRASSFLPSHKCKRTGGSAPGPREGKVESLSSWSKIISKNGRTKTFQDISRPCNNTQRFSTPSISCPIDTWMASSQVCLQQVAEQLCHGTIQ